jgi:hypothetical protein
MPRRASHANYENLVVYTDAPWHATTMQSVNIGMARPEQAAVDLPPAVDMGQVVAPVGVRANRVLGPSRHNRVLARASDTLVRTGLS